MPSENKLLLELGLPPRISHKCFCNDHYAFAFEVIAKGIDVDLKNNQEQTVYSVLQKKTARFCSIKGPLIKKIKMAIEERSQLRFKLPLDRFHTSDPIFIDH